jgi:hypothetical protein
MTGFVRILPTGRVLRTKSSQEGETHIRCSCSDGYDAPLHRTASRPASGVFCGRRVHLQSNARTGEPPTSRGVGAPERASPTVETPAQDARLASGRSIERCANGPPSSGYRKERCGGFSKSILSCHPRHTTAGFDCRKPGSCSVKPTCCSPMSRYVVDLRRVPIFRGHSGGSFGGSHLMIEPRCCLGVTRVSGTDQSCAALQPDTGCVARCDVEPGGGRATRRLGTYARRRTMIGAPLHPGGF